MTSYAPDLAARRPQSASTPQLKSVRAAGVWHGSMNTEVRVRDFVFHSDEPQAVGGTNSAPTPMEFVAGAVNACISVVIETIATELGIVLGDITTNTAAHIDVRGFAGTADVSPHFHDFTLTIRVVADADPNVLEQLRIQTERRCPALNLVRDAGVPVLVEWDFARDSAQPDATAPLAEGVGR